MLAFKKPFARFYVQNLKFKATYRPLLRREIPGLLTLLTLLTLHTLRLPKEGPTCEPAELGAISLLSFQCRISHCQLNLYLPSCRLKRKLLRHAQVSVGCETVPCYYR